MTFAESVKTVWNKYAEFGGRASRPEFWWWFLFTLLVACALSLFNVVPVGENSSLGSILGSIWGLATLIPSLAVGVRRLRDAGYTWANLFWLLLPIVGAIILIVYFAQPKSSKKKA